MNPKNALFCWSHWFTLPLKACALASMTILFGIAVLDAAPIPVNNASFEKPTLGSGGWTNNLLDPALGATDPQWTGRDGNNDGDTFVEYIGGFRSEGNQHLGMANGYFVFQNLGIPYAAKTTYKLTVAVGYRNANQSGTLSTTVIGLTALAEPPSDTNVLAGTNTNDQLAIDTLLAASSTSVDSVALNSATAGRFTDVTTQYTTGATPPVGNIVVFIGDDVGGARSHFDNVRLEAVSADNPDGDGIPAEWETGTDRGVPRNLNPGVNDGGLDFDGDTLTNFMEFQKGTHPRLADTDADGLNDNLETLTDPLKPDSDGDTLLDGAEVAAGTNPNDTDTDDDNFEDQAEKASGTNPLAAASKPSNNGDILLGVNFQGGNATSDGAQVTTQAGKFSQANWNNASGGSGGPQSTVNSAGAASILRMSWKTNGPAIVGAEPAAGDGNARLMHGILRPRGTAAVPGGDDIITQITVRNIAYPSYDLYVYLNAETGGQAIFTANDKTLTVSNILPYEGSFVQVPENAGEGNVIHFANLTGPTLTITQTIESGGIAGLQIVRSTTDTDRDGMPDLWEEANGTDKNMNDAAADPDADSSPNLQEFERLTNPRNADTDGDSLKDGVESKTGTYVSASNTGTDPLKADTDADGLLDGVEKNTGTFVSAENPGTNPNKADTDADGFNDSEEIAAASSPVNAASKPQLPAPLGYWSFNDQNLSATADLSPGGHPGTLQGGAVYVAGQSGAAGDFAIRFNGTDAAVTTGEPLLGELDQFTMSGWVNFTAAQANRTGIFGQNDVVEFAFSSSTTIQLWNPTGGAINTPSAPAGGGTWKHLAVTANETGRRIYINGVQVATGSVGTPTAAGGSFNIGGAGIADAAGNWFNGSIDDVAIWDKSLSQTFISQLANRTIAPIPPAASGALSISSFSFNEATRQFTLNYNTTAGTRYTVQVNYPATSSVWQDVATVAATGPLTTQVTTVQAGSRVGLFRVKKL